LLPSSHSPALSHYCSPRGLLAAGFRRIGRAATQLPLTGAIPLLLTTGTFGCWVSPLARCAPP
ncbi:hypothetical protein, partial [Salmonella sp. s39606]|uniref:hypothetical protein n=1 Tax=Salmonella sp. s39606 TaxID=3159643 RepID=UPI00397EC07F